MAKYVSRTIKQDVYSATYFDAIAGELKTTNVTLPENAAKTATKLEKLLSHECGGKVVCYNRIETQVKRYGITVEQFMESAIELPLLSKDENEVEEA